MHALKITILGKKEETPILAPFNNLLRHIPFCARSLISYSAFNV